MFLLEIGFSICGFWVSLVGFWFTLIRDCRKGENGIYFFLTRIIKATFFRVVGFSNSVT